MSHCFKLIYKINREKNIFIRIFGDNFVERNKNKFRIIYNNKEYQLKEFFEEIDENCEEEKEIKIKIRVFHNILNLSRMFLDCDKLLSIVDDEKVNEQQVKAKSYYDLSISKKKKRNLLKLLILNICFMIVNH